jgi:arylsulfatase A-like enzyme
VLVVVDTLRADAFRDAPPGKPASPKARMRFLGSLAARGTWFADAIAAAPWTMPSIASLLTGLIPSRHGADDLRNAPVLAPRTITFAEVLSRAYGYQTAAFVDGPWFGSGDGLLQGFQRVSNGFCFQGTEPMLEAWVRERDRTKPFFLLLHTLEVHEPYGAANHPWPSVPWRVSEEDRKRAAEITTPADLTRAFFLDAGLRAALTEARGPAYTKDVIQYITDGYALDPRPDLVADLRKGYDDGTLWFDGVLGSAFGRLERWGLLDDAVVVVAGDHGEGFAEHGIIGHGRRLDDELLRVPLIVSGPPPFRGGHVVRGTIGLVDVLPTIFDFAGLVPPSGIDGRSMLRLARGEIRGRPVVSQEKVNEANTARPGDAVLGSVRNDRWKWTAYGDRETQTFHESLFDLEADPSQANGLGPLDEDRWDDVGSRFCSRAAAERRRIVDSLRALRTLGGRTQAAGDLFGPSPACPDR